MRKQRCSGNCDNPQFLNSKQIYQIIGSAYTCYDIISNSEMIFSDGDRVRTRVAKKGGYLKPEKLVGVVNFGFSQFFLL